MNRVSCLIDYLRHQSLDQSGARNFSDIQNPRSSFRHSGAYNSHKTILLYSCIILGQKIRFIIRSWSGKQITIFYE